MLRSVAAQLTHPELVVVLAVPLTKLDGYERQESSQLHDTNTNKDLQELFPESWGQSGSGTTLQKRWNCHRFAFSRGGRTSPSKKQREDPQRSERVRNPTNEKRRETAAPLYKQECGVARVFLRHAEDLAARSLPTCAGASYAMSSPIDTHAQPPEHPHRRTVGQ